MLSPKTRRKVVLIVPFGVLWFTFSLIYCMLEKGILGDLEHYPSTGNQYRFAANIFAIPAMGLMMGLITGVLEIGYFSRWFIKKSFARKILFKSLLYLIITFIFLVFMLLMNALYTHRGHSFEVLVSPAWAFFTGFDAVGLMLYMSLVIFITQLYSEFSMSIGPGTLSNFFLGKYHHPVEEERIFMFLDMKSSTTIAESLGHVSYFGMLKEYFFDLSAAVIDFGGTIYQYAGDEMIICWKLKNGLNNNSIECFFAMKRALESQAEKYNSRFGIVPEFKAGVHSGMVTAGEIGSLKKEIIFTGDVLNTSARIQGLCNHFHAELLVSEDFAKLLHLPATYEIRSVGENLLKGRSKTMEVFAISIPNRNASPGLH